MAHPPLCFDIAVLLERQPFSSTGRCHIIRSSRLLILSFLVTAAAYGQQMGAIAAWATNESYTASLHQNVVYTRARGFDLRLDVIANGKASPRPVVVYFHGGGWVEGDKEGVLLRTLR